MSDFEYEIVDDFDHIFDEKGNAFLAFRKISWGGRPPKYDLRKWYNTSEGGERIGKGTGFLTEEGPDELTRVLVETGFGETNELMEILSNREDFDHEKYDDKLSILDSNEEYYDPRVIFEEE